MTIKDEEPALSLARDLIELLGYQVGRDIDIAITGLRPGEKLPICPTFATRPRRFPERLIQLIGW
ncbi:MAG: polysaccharide biosynthesis protein [Anaerolineales bacterium]|nr:polysaccharide biosynthesis protein [Anaerolineales bacterium]